MKNKFNVQWMLIACLIPLLASCNTNKTKAAEVKDLMEPETFMDSRKARIDRNVSMGPVVSEVDHGDLRKNSRSRIAQEKPKSYIDLDSTLDNVFPVSLHVENVSMQAIAQMLSEITGVNILVGDEVTGTTTAKLINVPWNKALDAVLKTKGLAKHVDREANIIRIHSQETLVSIEEFDRKRAIDLNKSLEAERAIEPLYTDIFRLFYTDPDVVKSQITSVFTGGGEGGDGAAAATTSTSAAPQITVDKRINSLIVKATREELDLISRLIEKIDIRTKQILIEAFVVEATDDFDKALGARLGFDGTKANPLGLDGSDTATLRAVGVGGTQPDTAGTLTMGDATGTLSNLAVGSAFGGVGFLLNTGAANLKLELTAMEQEGLTKIVSNPRIFTLDNEEAIVFQGEQIPYESSAGDGGGTEVEFKDAGIKLTVTPSIVGDGNVVLDVNITKDSANYANAIGNNPPIDKREISTKLLVKDNTIAVIGGVFKQEKTDKEEKVPGLGDIPILGKAFKRETKADQRTELLVFLAPRII